LVGNEDPSLIDDQVKVEPHILSFAQLAHPYKGARSMLYGCACREAFAPLTSERASSCYISHRC
jgi:hypothetical protein